MINNLFELPIKILILGFITCFVVNVLLILTKRWHGYLTYDAQSGVQKIHTKPTLRIGGIGIMSGITVATIFAPDSLNEILLPITLAAIPAFAIGLIEDITKRVSIKTRLAFSFLSGLLAWYLTDISLIHLNIPFIDELLNKWLFLSVLFTAFAVSGISNSINIIDGSNGLASGTVTIFLNTIGQIALFYNDTALAQLCFVIMAIIIGFMIMNFPFGKIFLGDGGSYLLGFLLAWCAILLPMRNPEVSSFTSLLICSYPIIEVMVSVHRRWKRNQSPGHPDRLHLHSLMNSRLIRKLFPYYSKTLHNAFVSPFIWSYIAVSQALAMLSQRTEFLILSLLICALLYKIIYTRIISFGWKLPAINKKLYLNKKQLQLKKKLI